MRLARKARTNIGGPIVSPAKQPLVSSRPSHTPPWANAGPIQFSLKVNAPNDKYEREADRAADQVMRMPEAAVQRKTCACGRPAGPDGMCEDCKREQLNVQRKASGEGGQTAAPPIVHNVLGAPGRPLDSPTRNFMESRFGGNFGSVRVHTNSQAAASAEAVNARAYTAGRNIVFGPGQYRPGTAAGRKLLAHELTHVVQQGGREESILTITPHTDIALQRSTGSESCGGQQPCATGDECSEPDPGFQGRPESSSEWILIVNVDIERGDFESALRSQEVGHTHVRFMESSGRQYTYGFYPAGEIPNENRREVPGCVHHPDTTHDGCVDERVMYRLSHDQYQAALGVAQQICRDRRTYKATYTCTTFAGEVAQAAGQSLPAMRSGPMTIYFQQIPPIDNPNTLYENIQGERQQDSHRRLPFWNDSCINRCEALFETCLESSRQGGTACIARRNTCLSQCPQP